MKSPNESNIEQWLFSYFEGDLNASEENTLEQFLLEHPEFDQTFEAWGTARFEPTSTQYAHINKIRKPLFSAGVLHRAAVLTAIGLNIGLASLLLMNRTDVANYKWVQLNASVKNSTDFSTNVLANNPPLANALDNNVSRQIEPYLEPNNENIKLLAQNALMLKNTIKSNRQVAISNQLHKFAAHEIFKENTNILADDVRLFSNESNSITLCNDSASVHISEDQLFESTKQLKATHLQEIEASAITPVTKMPPTSVKNQETKTSSHEKQNKLIALRDANNENTSRESETNKFFLNRFKHKGGIGLNNYRTPEYLIPGMIRNQINFGHVGSDFSNSAYLNTYFQRPQYSNSMITSQLGYDMYVPKIKSGFGFQILYNNYSAGALQNFEVSVTYSPKIQLKKHIMLEPSARLKMASTGVNRASLSPNTWMEYDKSNPFFYSTQQHTANVNSTIQQDLGLGFLVNSKFGYLGLNVDNIIGAQNHALHYQSNLYGNRAPVFLNAVLGTEYESLNKKALWSSHLVYQNHGLLNKFWLGSNIKYNYLSLGASISSNGEPMLSFGLATHDITLRYAADFSKSVVLNKKTMNHQLNLRILIKESRIKKMILN